MPSFIKVDGPIREARYRYKPDGSRDGGVHALYVISGRVDGPDSDAQRLHDPAGGLRERRSPRNNVVFRIPTPTFGLGLVEQIPDSAINANARADSATKTSSGSAAAPTGSCRPATRTATATTARSRRFGWKAQNKSLLLFSGEAYNVEMGITNELFQSERDETPNCQFAPTPNDITNTDAQTRRRP